MNGLVLLAVEAWGVLLACLPVRWPLSKVVVAYDIMWLFLEQSWMMEKAVAHFCNISFEHKLTVLTDLPYVDTLCAVGSLSSKTVAVSVSQI